MPGFSAGEQCANTFLKSVCGYLAANFADEAQSWVLAADGSYTRDLTPQDGRLFNCHRFFMENPSLSGRGTAGAKDVQRLSTPRDEGSAAAE